MLLCTSGAGNYSIEALLRIAPHSLWLWPTPFTPIRAEKRGDTTRFGR